jgi:hypothetical protein
MHLANSSGGKDSTALMVYCNAVRTALQHRLPLHTHVLQDAPVSPQRYTRLLAPQLFTHLAAVIDFCCCCCVQVVRWRAWQ